MKTAVEAADQTKGIMAEMPLCLEEKNRSLLIRKSSVPRLPVG